MDPVVPDVFVLIEGHVIRLIEVEAFIVDGSATRIQFRSGRYEQIPDRTPEDLMNEIANQITMHLNVPEEEK
jgi:hypothetical protein